MHGYNVQIGEWVGEEQFVPRCVGHSECDCRTDKLRRAMGFTDTTSRRGHMLL